MRVPSLLASFVLGASWLVASPVGADWRTDDPGAWGARRCQARNIMVGGVLLGMSGLAIASEPDREILGFALLTTGGAATITGAVLRATLRRDPGRDTAHDRWPGRRCELRAMLTRGSIYLGTFVSTLIHTSILMRRGTIDRTTGWIRLLVSLPTLVAGTIFTVRGARRLRHLGPRPPAPSDAGDGLVAGPLVTIEGDHVGVSLSPPSRTGRGGLLHLRYTMPLGRP